MTPGETIIAATLVAAFALLLTSELGAVLGLVAFESIMRTW